jgi:hypothetical protein
MTGVQEHAVPFSAAVSGQGFSNWCESRVVGTIKVDFDSTMFAH